MLNLGYRLFFNLFSGKKKTKVSFQTLKFLLLCSLVENNGQYFIISDSFAPFIASNNFTLLFCFCQELFSFTRNSCDLIAFYVCFTTIQLV